ncbi:MAG: hypothetical protein ABRQ38_10105 [Candidatus Eremiobacterota bacterium]
MDNIDQNLSARIEDMKVKMKLEAMAETILNMNAEMKIRFNSVEERLDKLEIRMDKLESTMDSFRHDIDRKFEQTFEILREMMNRLP